MSDPSSVKNKKKKGTSFALDISLGVSFGAIGMMMDNMAMDIR